MATPLLTTKLHIPSLRSSLVKRSYLLDRLSRGLRRRLTLVSAPAGFGKTTLLAEWVRDLREADSKPVKVAWISLDSGDNDPARFFAYLSAAVRRVDEDMSIGTDESVEVAGSLALEPYVIQLINQIATQPCFLVLVLDDYHLIASKAIHDALAFLVDHLSENMHLVLATRGDPPLPLARLRVRGELNEVRQSDLRFTSEEADTFLNDVAGLDLSPEEVSALESRTEGWIAGLRMASLAVPGWKMDGTRGLSRSIQSFAGTHRFILDYLVEEVLDQQPPVVKDFLLKTAILERLTGSLCDAVRFGVTDAPGSSSEAGDQFGMNDVPRTPLDSEASFGPVQRTETEPSFLRQPGAGGDSPSQPILEYLDFANLFIVPLDDDRRWYRYHRLFSDLLRKRLYQAHGGLALTLHRRASQWHEEQGLLQESIEHALCAEDYARAAELIEGGVEATFMRSEIVTILHWVERLPDELVCSKPDLCFFHAWALLMSGRSLDEVEQRLQDIADLPDGLLPREAIAGRVAALRAYSLLIQGDMRRAAGFCYQALEALPESDRPLRTITTWILSLARLVDGTLQDGSQELTKVATMGRELGNTLVAVSALCFQARVKSRQGRLDQAEEILERALQLATDQHGRRLPIASEALIGLGDLWREWNDLEAAADYLLQGIELATQWSEVAAFDAYGPLARVRAAQGDFEAAQEALTIAQSLALKSEATEVDDHVAALLQGRLLVAQNDVRGAMRWAEGRGLLPPSRTASSADLERTHSFLRDRLRKYEQEVLARLLILADRNAEAIDLLEGLLAEARQLDRIDLIIDFQILRALAFSVDGKAAQAMSALVEALSLAEPGGYTRIFLDEGPAMASLLRRASSRGIAPAYVKKLLAAFGASGSAMPQDSPPHPQSQPLLEPLSEREMDVLRLLAAGMSNPEIAEHLYIAVSTVRSHCKNIYAKLDVHRRWDAVQRAQELGLL